ncbi:MAG: hypothetical protein IJ129_00005 [Ruminococcus sp.]|nr:hypothetical protein [Ruminococcus sp.]
MKILAKIANLICLAATVFIAFSLIRCFIGMISSTEDVSKLPDTLSQMTNTYYIMIVGGIVAIAASVASFKGTGVIFTIIRTLFLGGIFVYDLVSLSDMKSDNFVKMALEGDKHKARSMGIGLAVTTVAYVLLFILSLVAMLKKNKDD